MGYLYDFAATSKDFKRRAGRLDTYVRQLPDDFGVQMSAAADIRLIEALRVEILSIEKAVMRHAKDFDRELLELLQTIPGLGTIISLGILYEADDFSRRIPVRNVAQPAGLNLAVLAGKRALELNLLAGQSALQPLQRICIPMQSIMNADLILVFDKGEICQSGKHEELVNQEGIYRQIFDIQRL